MADIKIGDRVELLERRYNYDAEIMDVGTFGTVVGGLDEDDDYNVDWDCKDGSTQRRYAHKDTIKGAGLRFNEVFQQEAEPEAKRVSGKDVDTLPVGTILRGTELSKGDRGYEFEVRANGRVRTVRHGVADSFTFPLCYDNYEIVSTPEKPAETVAETVEVPVLPLTHGEVINVALERLRGAADVIDQAFGTVTKEDQELAAGLRVVVAALIINPRGEQALRKLIGE